MSALALELQQRLLARGIQVATGEALLQARQTKAPAGPRTPPADAQAAPAAPAWTTFAHPPAPPVLTTITAPADGPAAYLTPGALHEFILASEVPDAGSTSAAPSSRQRGPRDDRPLWHPPLLLMTALAAEAHRRRAADGAPAAQAARPPVLVCIGRTCWPTLYLLRGIFGGRAERQCVLLDPLTDALRVWASEQALRCTGVDLVLADGSGLALPAWRRLQLAAEARGALGFLARPPAESTAPSWATTRWCVRPAPAPPATPAETFDLSPRWSVELTRCKGVQPKPPASCRWLLAWGVCDGQSVVRVLADVADRPVSAEGGAAGGTRAATA